MNSSIDVNNRYNEASSFSDLLQINIDFLLNKISETHYYCGPFGDCEDHEPRRPYLVDLHQKYRIYTVNGQTNILEDTYIQHSYLIFFVENPLGQRLENVLFSDPDIYTCVSTKHRQFDNFPTEEFALTSSRVKKHSHWKSNSRWCRDIYWFDETVTSYDNVNDIFSSCYVYVIVSRNPKSRETDEVLRDILDRLD